MTKHKKPQPNNILVVDANPQMRSVIRSILVETGLKSIRETGDIQTAIALLGEYQFAIVIIDYPAIGGDGIQFIRDIRMGLSGHSPLVPILMTSVRRDELTVKLARDVGVSEFLGKPVTTKALLSRIYKVLTAPRKFISTKSYTGPCRRRKQSPLSPDLPQRRKTDEGQILRVG